MTTSCIEFKGKKVLVVESEFLMPFNLYRAIEELGAQLIGPVDFRDDLVLVLKGNCPDGVIVDNRLEASDIKVVRRILRRMHVPFVVACRRSGCVSGQNGCFRLSEVKGDLTVLGRALFA
jgi:hypothetical protein